MLMVGVHVIVYTRAVQNIIRKTTHSSEIIPVEVPDQVSHPGRPFHTSFDHFVLEGNSCRSELGLCKCGLLPFC